jgi:CBS domain-containing protein
MSRSKSLREEFPSLIDRAYNQLKSRRFVADIMSKDIITIPPNASMAEAAKLMGANHVGSLLVETDENVVVGIVTERDLLSKILAEGRNPDTVRVCDIMSTPLLTIAPSATIKQAAQAMITKKGRLVVFQKTQLVGIVTAADLIKSFPETSDTSLRVNDVMTRTVKMVPDNVLIDEVVKILGSKRIGSVLVTKNGLPFGIFTERDLLTTFLARGKSLETPVGVAASTPLLTLPSGSTIHEAALTMSLKRIRRLPIEKDFKIIGILTARDLVEAYSK